MNTKLILSIVILSSISAGLMIYSGVFSSKTTTTSEVLEDTTYYTCPMHPSVRSDKPGACPVCGMMLVGKTKVKAADLTHPGSAAGGTANQETVNLSPEQRVNANVSVTKATRRSINRAIHAVGVVSYAEPNYRHISMRFPGRLEKLYVAYTGQTVRKGDPVADVYSPEAISAQQEFLLSLDSYEQAMLSTENAVTQTAQSNRPLAVSARQMLEQSKDKLLHWGFTDRQISRLKETRQPSYIVTIYSQVSGTVVKKNVDAQHYVATGEDMFDVADLSTVWIYLDVYEKDIRHVSREQSALITSEAYPGEEFKGWVVFIDPVLNPETRTIRVRTEFPNPEEKLKPNMFVDGMIAIPSDSALVVPSSAILSTGKRTIIWVEVEENAFAPRDVVVGLSNEGFTEIIQGLEEGAVVAETGGFLIDSESALQRPTGPDPHAGHSMKEGK